jgi:hypothetical protein
MTSIPDVAQALEQVLTEVADQAARATGFVQRASKLTGAKFVQTLVLGWLHTPDASLSQLTQMAATLGVLITPQGLDQRLGRAAAACLQRVLEAAVGQVVAAEPQAPALLQRFGQVTVQDSSTLGLPPALAAVWPGCGGSTAHGDAALKVQVRWELCTGQLLGPFLAAGRAPDQTAALQHAPLVAGALRLADLGYFSLDVFRDLSQQGVYWLSRLQCQTAVFEADGRRRALAQWLPAEGRAVLDCPVTLGTRHHLPARLLAVPVPPPVAAARRRKLRAEARAKGRTVSRTRLVLAGWTVLVTNLPPEQLTVAEALVLARVRWQIELLFKLWKQHGRIDEARSAAPWHILCTMYAKLAAMIVQHWCFLVGAWDQPDRSLVQAAALVRTYTLLVARALAGRGDLVTVLTELGALLAQGGRLQRRAKAPSTYQLLVLPPPVPSDTAAAA